MICRFIYLFQSFLFIVYKKENLEMVALGDIQSNLAQQDVDKLFYQTYSPKDFDRWDSYESRFACYAPAAATRDAFTSAYLTNIRSKFSTQYLAVMYTYFIGHLRGGTAFNTILSQGNYLNTTDIYQNCGMALNYAYNIYRKSKFDSGLTQSQFDALDINWLSLPTVPATAAVIESWINLYFSVQTLDHGSISDGRGTYDKFGYFALNNGFGNSIVPGNHYFHLSGIASVCCHYSHLLTSSTLKQLRMRMMAAMTALYNYILTTGQQNQASTAQWITRHSSFSTATAFIIMSENRLRERGNWAVSDDISTTNRNNGLWTQSDALDYATYLCQKCVDYSKQNGIEEYNSSYYGFVMQQISIAIIHAPSQTIYNLWNQLFKIYWLDISLNLFPASSCLSGPAARTSRMLLTTNTAIDRHDSKIFVEPLFTQSLKSFVGKIHPNSSTFATADPIGIDPYRMIFTCKQLGHLDWFLPHILIKNNTIGMPYHIQKARFSPCVGQERYNFVTPFYTIGNSGEDLFFTGANVKFCARLGGKTAVSQNVLTDSCIPIVQFICNTNSNDTFSNKNGIILENDQITSRQLTSQFQGFALITHVIDSGYVDNSGTKGLSIELILPININGGIYINKTSMKISSPNSMTVPADSVISVKHNGASVFCRLLYSTHNVNNPAPILSNYADTRVLNLSTNNPIAQPFHLMFQVDQQSLNYGCARFIVTFKNQNNLDQSNCPYRASWLVCAGETTNDAERINLQNIVQNSIYKQQFSEVIPIRDKPYYDFVKYQKHWYSEVKIANTLTLSVQRTDIRSMNNNDLIYRDGIGSFNQGPYFMTGFNRLVNGVDINSVSGNSGFLLGNVPTAELFEPHRNKTTITATSFFDSLVQIA